MKRSAWMDTRPPFSIGTGKLEASIYTIKVVKRIGYGYRDDGCFFTLLAISLPAHSASSLSFPSKEVKPFDR